MSPAPDARRWVLTAESLAEHPGTAKTHFLNPNGRRTNWSLGDMTGLTGLGVHLIEVPAGAESTEMHVHHDEDEGVYVLSGRGTVTLDDETFAIEPGTFVGFPAGGPAHVLHNPGPEPLRCLVVGQRLAHDVADYPRLKKRLFRSPGGWNLVDHASITDPKKAPGSTVGKK